MADLNLETPLKYVLNTLVRLIVYVYLLRFVQSGGQNPDSALIQ